MPPASTECTDDTAIPNWRLMARKPIPCFFSAMTSSARLCSDVGRPSRTPLARAEASAARFSRSVCAIPSFGSPELERLLPWAQQIHCFGFGCFEQIMHNPVIEKFIGEPKRARQTYITTDTQVVCGRVVLSALPSIDSDVVRSFRLDLPADVQPSESPYWLLFLVSVFDAQTFCDIQPRIRPAVIGTAEYSEVINVWRLRMFTKDGHRVVLAEAASPPP